MSSAKAGAWRRALWWLAMTALVVTGGLLLRRALRAAAAEPSTCLSCVADDLESSWTIDAIGEWNELLATTPQSDQLGQLSEQVDEWILEPRARDAHLYARFHVAYVLDTGAVGSLELRSVGRHGFQTYRAPRAFVAAPGQGAGWPGPRPSSPKLTGPLRITAPRQAHASVASSRIRVTTRVDPARQWASSEASVSLTMGASPTAVFELPALRASTAEVEDEMPRDREADIFGFDLVEVSQGGRPCRFINDGEEVAVRPWRPEGPVELRFRYEGAPADREPGQLLLRSWIPIAIGSQPAMELTLLWPESHQVLGLGPPTTPPSTRDGWTSATWQVPAGAAPPLAVISPRATAATELRIGEATVRVHGPAERLRPALEMAYQALREVQLPWPSDLEVVLARSRASGRALLVLERSIDRPRYAAALRWHVARMIAAQWFGQQVTDAPDGTVSVTAALAGYLALAAVSPADGVRVRSVLASYDANAPARSILRTMATQPTAERWNEARATLILAALGERLGRARMLAVVRRLYRPGQELSWRSVITEVTTEAGAAQAQWLATWLDLPRLPRCSYSRSGSPKRRTLDLVCDDEKVRAGLTIPIVFHRGERELARLAPTTGAEGSIEQLAVPDGADGWTIDPELRSLVHLQLERSTERLQERLPLDLREWP